MGVAKTTAGTVVGGYFQATCLTRAPADLREKSSADIER